MTDFYAALAADLHRAADAIAALAGKGHPKPAASLFIQPWSNCPDDADSVSMVDALAGLFGTVGTTEQMPSGLYQHGATGFAGALKVSVFAGVTPPEQQARNEEIARLCAELARLTGADERCPDPECGKPLRLIAAGTVRHCGRTCGAAEDVNR